MKTTSRWDIPPEIEELGMFRAEEIYTSAVREYRKAGKDVLAFFGSNPPREGFINKPLSDALIEAARMDTETYASGTTLFNDLKDAISNFEKKHRNIECPPEHIILGPGVAGCFNVLHYTILGDGDEVITFNPAHYLSGPAKYIHIFGSKVVPCRTIEAEKWQPDFEDLQAKITNKTKAIVICNPNNPLGCVWDEKTLKGLVDIAGEHQIPIISDEIYGLITFDGIEAESILDVAHDAPAIMMSGMSKFFMRPGWRVGYICFNNPEGAMDDIIERARKVAFMYGHPAKSLSTPILYAALKAYQNYRGAFEAGNEMVRETQKHRDFVWKRLKEIDGVTCTKPEGALYAFPRLSEIGKKWKTDLEFLLELLKEESVAWHIGSRYGKLGFGHLRVLLQPKLERLEEAFNRLERFLLKHSKD